MGEYRASLEHLGPESALGPFVFQRAVFADSNGRCVEAWSCTTATYGRASRNARTRAHALAYWLAAQISRKIWYWRHPEYRQAWKP